MERGDYDNVVRFLSEDGVQSFVFLPPDMPQGYPPPAPRDHDLSLLCCSWMPRSAASSPLLPELPCMHTTATTIVEDSNGSLPLADTSNNSQESSEEKNIQALSAQLNSLTTSESAESASEIDALGHDTARPDKNWPAASIPHALDEVSFIKQTIHGHNVDVYRHHGQFSGRANSTQELDLPLMRCVACDELHVSLDREDAAYIGLDAGDEYNVYVEIMHDTKHACPFARLSGVLAWEHGELANQLGIRVEWKTASGEFKCLYLQATDRVTPTSPDPPESYCVALGLIFCLQQQVPVPLPSWWISYGIPVIWTVDFDCFEQVFSVREVQAVTQVKAPGIISAAQRSLDLVQRGFQKLNAHGTGSKHAPDGKVHPSPADICDYCYCLSTNSEAEEVDGIFAAVECGASSAGGQRCTPCFEWNHGLECTRSEGREKITDEYKRAVLPLPFKELQSRLWTVPEPEIRPLPKNGPGDLARAEGSDDGGW